MIEQMKFTVQKATSIFVEGAYFEVVRHGQRPPSISDNVKVTATLYIPQRMQDFNEREIVEELQFGSRVSVFGQSLVAQWGNPTGNGYRSRTREFAASTWAEAFAAAQKYCAAELGKIRDAVDKRAAALRAADQ